MIGNLLLCVLRLSENNLSEFYCRAAMNARRSNHDKAVCPSVRLSVCLSVCQTHDLLQNERNLCPHSYTTWKTSYASFAKRRMVGAGDPFSLKFWVIITAIDDFGTNQKPIGNFLLVNNTNLCPISQTRTVFQAIANYLSNFNALVRGESLNSWLRNLASRNY